MYRDLPLKIPQKELGYFENSAFSRRFWHYVRKCKVRPDERVGDLMEQNSNNVNRFREWFESPQSDFSIVDRYVSQSQIEDNLCNTPLGRMLGIISQLPEIRYEKVERIRSEIHSGRYDLKENLDAALDKVLDEIIVES